MLFLEEPVAAAAAAAADRAVAWRHSCLWNGGRVVTVLLLLLLQQQQQQRHGAAAAGGAHSRSSYLPTEAWLMLLTRHTPKQLFKWCTDSAAGCCCCAAAPMHAHANKPPLSISTGASNSTSWGPRGPYEAF